VKTGAGHRRTCPTDSVESAHDNCARQSDSRRNRVIGRPEPAVDEPHREHTLRRGLCNELDREPTSYARRAVSTRIMAS
jgi:hypothetical protein